MEEKYTKESKEILDPILDVFGAADCGIAFAKLYHGHFPAFLKTLEEDSKNYNARAVVDAFKLVSKMCKYTLEN
jgi:hypothetical protein